MKKTRYEFGLFLNRWGNEQHALGSTEFHPEIDELEITVWLGAIKADQLDTDEFDEILEMINYITLVETACAHNIEDWNHPYPLCKSCAHLFGDRCPFERTMEVMGEPVRIKKREDVLAGLGSKIQAIRRDWQIKNYDLLEEMKKIKKEEIECRIIV